MRLKHVLEMLAKRISLILFLINIKQSASETCLRYEYTSGNYWMHVGSRIFEIERYYLINSFEIEGTCTDDVVTYDSRKFTKFTATSYNKNICNPSPINSATPYNLKTIGDVKFDGIHTCLIYILNNNDAGDPNDINLSVIWNSGVCRYISRSADPSNLTLGSQFCRPTFMAFWHDLPDSPGGNQFYVRNLKACIIRAHRLSIYKFVYFNAHTNTCYALNLNEDNINIHTNFALTSRKFYYIFPLRFENECREMNCSSQDCTLSLNGARCECPDGYQYREFDASCVDICLPCMGGNCEKDLEYEEGYRCMTCPDGYEVSDDGLRCEDVDECSQDTIVCHHCVNNVGSYNCSCNAGYVLNEDLTSCINVNECETQDICVNATCEDTPGSYTCNCNDGFKQVEGSSNHCEDIDECSNDPFICEQECTNLVGSFKCSCNDGYALAPNGRNCTDIDECLRDPSPCQQQCNNLEGSFSCSCHAGYAFDKDEITCIEATKSSHVDVTTESTESQEPSLEPDTSDTTKSTACDGDSSPCAHFCKEMNDSFVCSCKEGYALASDGSSCEESGISAGATIGLIAGSLTILGSVVGIMAVYSKKANQALVFDDNSSKI